MTASNPSRAFTPRFIVVASVYRERRLKKLYLRVKSNGFGQRWTKDFTRAAWFKTEEDANAYRDELVMAVEQGMHIGRIPLNLLDPFKYTEDGKLVYTMPNCHVVKIRFEIDTLSSTDTISSTD